MLCLLSTLFWPTLPPVEVVEPPQYSWDRHFEHSHPRIVREHFYCKGEGTHPIIVHPHDGERMADCRGIHDHGLPMRDGEEFVYEIFLDLLNWLQERTDKRVVITCGHRCPIHNTYADPTPYNRTSKHQVAAEVDFFIEGMEQDAEAVVELIISYYADSERSDLRDFKRYEKPDTNVRTPPWYNKELFIKLFQADEGRDLDNAHDHPYIGMQVRWDRESDERVIYSWQAARRYARDVH